MWSLPGPAPRFPGNAASSARSSRRRRKSGTFRARDAFQPLRGYTARQTESDYRSLRVWTTSSQQRIRKAPERPSGRAGRRVPYPRNAVEGSTLRGGSPDNISAGPTPGQPQVVSPECRRNQTFEISASSHTSTTENPRWPTGSAVHPPSRTGSSKSKPDTMDIERSAGSRLNPSPCAWPTPKDGQTYMLHLIDTPGHVDFAYGSQSPPHARAPARGRRPGRGGTDPQTPTGRRTDLEIIPVISIDLPAADIDDAPADIEDVIGPTPPRTAASVKTASAPRTSPKRSFAVPRRRATEDCPAPSYSTR